MKCYLVFACLIILSHLPICAQDFQADHDQIELLLSKGDVKGAEKLAKKKIANEKENISGRINLGYIYSSQGKKDKADKEFEYVIKHLTANQDQILQAGRCFIAIHAFDFAIASYKMGAKLLKGIYPFSMELAEVYNLNGDYPAMVNQYLDVLELGPNYLPSVQNALQINEDKNNDPAKNEIIKKEILKRVQAKPEIIIFSELLIYILVQEQHFEMALQQIIGLDKRRGEDGERVFNFAQDCIQNERLGVAEKALQYLLLKGPENYYYNRSRVDILHIKFKQLAVGTQVNPQEVQTLIAQYQLLLKDIGITNESFPLVIELSKLYSAYLHTIPDALLLVEKTINIKSLSNINIAQCKLMLGDLHLQQGDIWDASLLFSQVEKQFKYDQIGQEAKFRNAKISFYTADFKWAQAQLDVLKSSTTKLIANDAMALSILIADITGWDSITLPLEMYGRAELLALKNQDSMALRTLDSIEKVFKGNPIQEQVLFSYYAIDIKNYQFIQAAEHLKEIVAHEGHFIQADKATFYLAQLYENQLSNKTLAMQYYQDLLLKFGGSIYTPEARRKFRMLRGDKISQ